MPAGANEAQLVGAKPAFAHALVADDEEAEELRDPFAALGAESWCDRARQVAERHARCAPSAWRGAPRQPCRARGRLAA